MALAFKRSRMDQAHDRTFPNAKEEVIFRTDVSNKNLLKNPFRTAGIPVGPVGVQNRPTNRLVDNRGAVYAESTSVLRKGITNNNLLHNPYRFKVDPIDEPRTLSMQVIKDINDGTAPQYVRENKGIDEIAFMIVKALPDNGVKLATISMLKSYITGLRLQSILDQGGQNVTRAFDILNQLVVTSKNLFKTGALGMKLPGLLLDYSSNIANVFGDTVLQPVSPMLMFSAIQDLASVSSVLSKLFKSQNAISAPTNVSIDEWARMEAARLQSIREREAKQEIIDNNAPQVKVAGDNQPTGTQGVKDADTIKQEGTGMRRKKKKLSEMMGGAQIDWGIANPGGQVTPTPNPGGQVTPTPNPTPNSNNPINNLPLKEPINVKLVDSTPWYETVKNIGQAGVVLGSTALGAYNIWNAWNDRSVLEQEREAIKGDREKERIRDIRDRDRFREEGQIHREEILRSEREKQRHRVEQIERIVRPYETLIEIGRQNPELYNIFDTAYATAVQGYPITLLPLDGYNVYNNNIDIIMRGINPVEQLRRLKQVLIRQIENPDDINFEQGNLAPISKAVVPPGQGAAGKKSKKSIKSKKSKTKKSKNLDAQILALLKA